LLFLYFHPGKYKTLFYLAFFPGILAICFSFFIREQQKPSIPVIRKTRFLEFFKYWKESPAPYRRLVAGLLLFALFNSSDVFLLLKIKEAGYNDIVTIGTYIFYNLFYALFAYPLGILADRWGLKRIFIFGLAIFVVVYAGMAFNRNIYFFFLLFLLYGFYAAATEGVAKAWISNISSRKDTATAIGTYTAFQSICTLIASSLSGYLWFRFGSLATLSVIAFGVLGIIVYFILIEDKTPKHSFAADD
jgi:MFS family permease